MTGISGEGTSPPKLTPGAGQEGVVSPHARMILTPRLSGSIRAEAQGSRHVDDRVPVRKDKYRGCGEFREKSANCILRCGGELERGALFQEGRHRAYVVSHVRQEFAVITKTAK